MVTYWELLQAIVKKNSARPFYTWISDAGRVELSGATFLNAVSKASNFLVDGLDLDSQAKLEVDLGNHWQSPVWLGAALTLGLTITDVDPQLTFGTKPQAQVWTGSPENFVVVSQDPFGMPDKEIPAGFVNGSAEVRNFGDFFAPSWSVASEQAVIQFQSREFTWIELATRGRELAEQYEIERGKGYGIHGTSDVVTLAALQMVLPVTNENSVVLIDQTSPDFDAIKKQEKLDQIVLLS